MHTGEILANLLEIRTIFILIQAINAYWMTNSWTIIKLDNPFPGFHANILGYTVNLFTGCIQDYMYTQLVIVMIG